MRTAIHLLIILLVSAPVALMADQSDVEYDGGEAVAAPEREQEVNKASNASFDKRLPPVLPGEVLNDGHSKTKVWSTAGPLGGSAYVPQPPQPPQAPGYAGNNPVVGDVDVIVDTRDGHRRHKGRR